jgi:hypothetical protein
MTTLEATSWVLGDSIDALSRPRALRSAPIATTEATLDPLQSAI